MQMKDTRLCNAAAMSASNDPALAGIGFDPLSIIISLLLPFVQNLFNNCFVTPPTPATTKRELQAAYDDGNGEYDRSVGAPVARHAKRIAHQQHHNIDNEQARAIAVHMLDNVRTADDEVVGEAMAAAA